MTGRADQPGTPEHGAEELAQAFEAQRPRDGGGVLTVVSFTIDRGRITALDVIRNPDKLAALRELAD